MKLTPEQIEKIEEILTDVEMGELNRTIIIKHQITSLQHFTFFLSVIRSIGIPVARGKRTIVNKSELAEFRRWLLAQAADKAQERAAP